MKAAPVPSWAAEGQEKRAARMARVDRMPPEIRACVHEHGLTIVDTCMALGIKKAKHINHLVKTIRDQSYQGVRDRAPPGALPPPPGAADE